MRPIEIKSELPQEAINKILGNTKEDMDRMLSPGYTIDLSDGKDRTVTYISFPNGTTPEDVAPVAHAHWVAVENGVGVCSNCNRQDHIDPIATHCRYCGAVLDGREHV